MHRKQNQDKVKKIIVSYLKRERTFEEERKTCLARRVSLALCDMPQSEYEKKSDNEKQAKEKKRE